MRADATLRAWPQASACNWLTSAMPNGPRYA